MSEKKSEVVSLKVEKRARKIQKLREALGAFHDLYNAKFKETYEALNLIVKQTPRKIRKSTDYKRVKDLHDALKGMVAKKKRGSRLVNLEARFTEKIDELAKKNIEAETQLKKE